MNVAIGRAAPARRLGGDASLNLLDSYWRSYRTRTWKENHNIVHCYHSSSVSDFGTDRISSQGTLRNHTRDTTQHYVIGQSMGSDEDGKARRIVPNAPPLTMEQLDSIDEFVRENSRSSRGLKKSIIAITGAGLSTESGIPDYRSANGAYSTGFRPMTHQQFMASAQNRSRYWARSFAGWAKFSEMQPNAAHQALAQLQSNGYIDWIITQNVDRLHQKGGSDPRKTLELHGTTHRVACMDCGHMYPRDLVQQWLARVNPDAYRIVQGIEKGESRDQEEERLARAGTNVPVQDSFKEAPQQNPDGDVELQNQKLMHSFVVPSCPNCGTGVLKPDVVFFGDSLPPGRTQTSKELASQASGVLVVGSSLAVWSAFRLVKQAKDNGASVCILTAGDTRADAIADLKLNVLAGEALPMVSTRFQIPNVF